MKYAMDINNLSKKDFFNLFFAVSVLHFFQAVESNFFIELNAIKGGKAFDGGINTGTALLPVGLALAVKVQALFKVVFEKLVNSQDVVGGKRKAFTT